MKHEASAILDVEISILRALAGARRIEAGTLIYLLEMALEEAQDVKGRNVKRPA